MAVCVCQNLHTLQRVTFVHGNYVSLKELGEVIGMFPVEESHGQIRVLENRSAGGTGRVGMEPRKELTVGWVREEAAWTVVKWAGTK